MKAQEEIIELCINDLRTIIKTLPAGCDHIKEELSKAISHLETSIYGIQVVDANKIAAEIPIGDPSGTEFITKRMEVPQKSPKNKNK